MPVCPLCSLCHPQHEAFTYAQGVASFVPTRGRRGAGRWVKVPGDSGRGLGGFDVGCPCPRVSFPNSSCSRSSRAADSGLESVGSGQPGIVGARAGSCGLGAGEDQGNQRTSGIGDPVLLVGTRGLAALTGSCLLVAGE